MWNDCNCCCDGKTVRELKKKVDKAVYSIGLNGDILYPTDGTGNLNLGDIGGSYDARDILMPDGSDVAENIEDLQSGKVDAVAPVNVDNGINLNVTKNGDTTQAKIAKGSDSVTISEGTIQLADAVKQTIENASATATEADAKADDAQADATDALTKANNAVKSASSGIYGGDANKLALTLETNQGTKVNVPLIADSSDIDMSEHTAGYWILKLKDAVKNKLNAAYKAFSTSVVDKALEATVETNDGSTATIPLFEIGDGLEWVEKTLKATGGTADEITITSGDNLEPLFTSDLHAGDIVFIAIENSRSAIRVPSTLSITSGDYATSISSWSTSITTFIADNNFKLSLIAKVESISTTNCYMQIISATGSNYSKTGTGKVSISKDGETAITDAISATIPDQGIAVGNDQITVSTTNYIASIQYRPLVMISYKGINQLIPVNSTMYNLTGNCTCFRFKQNVPSS